MIIVCICDYRPIWIYFPVPWDYEIPWHHVGISFFLALSRHYKQYYQVHFLIILFGKFSFSESLSSFGTESETERMTDLEKFGFQPYSLEQTKSKVPVAYGKNFMSDLASSSNATTNDDGRIGNKIWRKCQCCVPMETSIESVCCL